MTRAHQIDGRRIDLTVRSGMPRVLSGAAIARLAAAALEAGGAPAATSLSIVLTDDAELAELNIAHLGHAGPTDVLSFPLLPPEAFPVHEGRSAVEESRSVAGGAPFILPPGAPIHLGDIAVSVERAIAHALEGRGGQTGDVRWSPANELRLLVTHGALHVCGWDHGEPVEEAAMRVLERRLLG